MDHPLNSVINASEEVAAANAVGDKVRLFKVKHVVSTDPKVELMELLELETRWTPSSNITATNFSATCFLCVAPIYDAWPRVEEWRILSVHMSSHVKCFLAFAQRRLLTTALAQNMHSRLIFPTTFISHFSLNKHHRPQHHHDYHHCPPPTTHITTTTTVTADMDRFYNNT